MVRRDKTCIGPVQVFFFTASSIIVFCKRKSIIAKMVHRYRKTSRFSNISKLVRHYKTISGPKEKVFYKTMLPKMVCRYKTSIGQGFNIANNGVPSNQYLAHWSFSTINNSQKGAPLYYILHGGGHNCICKCVRLDTLIATTIIAVIGEMGERAQFDWQAGSVHCMRHRYSRGW